MVSVMGSSGSGKSTQLNIIGRLDTYDTGEYWLDDTLIEGVSETRAAHLRNRFFGFVFQAFNLIPFKSALENVALPLYYQNISRKKRNLIALEYLDKMGIREWADHLPGELSGGQQQRVAIARTLLLEPKIVVFDDSTAAIDAETEQRLLAAISEYAEDWAVIIVAHRLGSLMHADEILFVDEGRIIERGKHEELLELGGRYRALYDLQANPVDASYLEQE